MNEKELTTEEWKQQKKEQRARFTALQNLPYEVKVRRQARRAWQYYEEIMSRDANCPYLKVGERQPAPVIYMRQDGQVAFG